MMKQVLSFCIIGLLGLTMAQAQLPQEALFRAVQYGNFGEAVNLLDASESDPRVAQTLQIVTSTQQAQAQSVEIRKEIWPWFAWGALAVLLLEWMLYARRMHI